MVMDFGDPSSPRALLRRIGETKLFNFALHSGHSCKCLQVASCLHIPMSGNFSTQYSHVLQVLADMTSPDMRHRHSRTYLIYRKFDFFHGNLSSALFELRLFPLRTLFHRSSTPTTSSTATAWMPSCHWCSMYKAPRHALSPPPCRHRPSAFAAHLRAIASVVGRQPANP